MGVDYTVCLVFPQLTYTLWKVYILLHFGKLRRAILVSIVLLSLFAPAVSAEEPRAATHPALAFSLPPEVSPLILRPITAKEKRARLSFLADRKVLALRVGENTPKICSDIVNNFKSQTYKILKPREREIYVRRSIAFPSKRVCPDLEIGRVYVPATPRKKEGSSNTSASYAVDVTRNLEGYDLSDYSEGIWLYTGEETIVDKESAKEVTGMIGHENETLVRLVDKKKCLIKTPVEGSLRMLRRYNIYIDSLSWKAFYEDTPSFSAVLDMGGHLYFLAFSSFFVSWNQFLSSSDAAGVLTLERIDLVSGKFEKVCNFNINFK